MTLIPELGAERIVLPHVDVINTLGRRIAGEFHDRSIGPLNITIAGDMAGLQILGCGLRELGSKVRPGTQGG